METIVDTTYRIESQRGGIFQLWTPVGEQPVSNETLVIMYGFYGATQNAIAKYCDIYLGRGLKVLYIPSRFIHFVWPSNAITLGEILMDYLDDEASAFSYYIVHSFSMGGYNFSVCNYSVMSAQPERYGHIKLKIKAVVFDSIALGSPERMMKGIGMGMTRNKVLQTFIPSMMSLYFFLMQNYTVKLFEKWIEMCRTMPLEVPTLYFFCENDPISDYKYIEEMLEGFRKMGTFPVLGKCWQKSRHSIHLMIHTKDYLEYLSRLLELVPEFRKLNQKTVISKI